MEVCLGKNQLGWLRDNLILDGVKIFAVCEKQKVVRVERKEDGGFVHTQPKNG